MPDVKTYNEGGEEKLYKWVIGETKPAPAAPTAKTAPTRSRPLAIGEAWASRNANASVGLSRSNVEECPAMDKSHVSTNNVVTPRTEDLIGSVTLF